VLNTRYTSPPRQNNTKQGAVNEATHPRNTTTARENHIKQELPEQTKATTEMPEPQRWQQKQNKQP